MDEAAGTPGTAGQVAGPRVLIVDDEQAIRAAYAEAFSAEGYAVATARNGQEAIAQLQAQPAALVLMDLVMPVLDGLTACKVLMADAATRDIPVIIISAANNLEARATEIRRMAAAVVAKPLDFAELLATVEQFIAEHPLGA